MRTKRIILFIVSMLLISSMNIVDLYAAKGAPTANIIAETTVNNAGEFNACIFAAMKEAKDVVKIKIGKYDKATYEVSSTVSKILKDNAELFYIKNCTGSWVQDKGKSSGIMTINIYYLYPKDKIIQMKNELNSKVDSIISKEVQMDMSNATKELMLHDYLVMNTSDGIGSVQEELSTAYSVLVKGMGNNRGYTMAMKLLLNKVGIECMIVEGTDYVWNIVKVEGDYYHLDASSDKLNNAEGKEVLTHDYFNVSDLEMARYYDWDTSKYPVCTSNKCNYFYMNNTIVNTVDEFEAQIKNAILQVKDSISIRVTNFDNSVYSISDTIISVINKNPVLDDIAEWYWVENSNLGTVNAIFRYDFTKSEVLLQRQKTEEKANEIIASIIKTGMGDYIKVLTVHNYIIRNASYDSQNADKNTIPPEEHDAYGVLVKGVGVCDSYAEAMKLLLDKAGIECIIVEGDEVNSTNDIGHAWNIVKIDGNYYHVDATWDDKNREGKETLVYYYFNVNDEEMKKTHVWDSGKYPPCTSTEQNYFYKNKLVAHNYTDAFNRIKNALRVKDTKLVMKIEDYDSSEYNIEDMIEKAFYKSGISRLEGGSWFTYDDIGIIDIEFKY